MKKLLLAAMASLALSATGFALAPGWEDVFKLEKDLKFDDLFPRRSHFGPAARVLGFSQDDRYLAYVWSGWNTFGNELWLYDTRSGKSEQITSPEMFAKFDGDVMKAKKEFEENNKRWEEWEKLDDTKYREEQEKFQEEQRKRRGPRPNYGTVSDVAWGKKKNEMLFIYKGDIYRWMDFKKDPTRLTWTSESEGNIEYLPDDSGFVFRRGNGVYRMQFDSPAVMQINPSLTGGVNFTSYRLSKDGKQMLVFGSKSKGESRQVDYIVYRNRFAEARKTSRGVADDDFMSESYMYLYDITPEALTNPDKESKAFEIWKWPGGEEYQETSISDNPWSPDGKSFVFGTWARDKKEWKLLEANLETQKVRTVWEGTSDGEHRTPSLMNPFYNHEGDQIVCLLDRSGWRQMHLIDAKSGKETQVTRGEFETYPLYLSSDKGYAIAEASKEHLARMDFYKVNLKSGAMERMTSKDGTYEPRVKANKSDMLIAQFNSWHQMRETFVISKGKETQMTDSHRSKPFWDSIKIQPELFTFTNRHGDTIHGYMYLPPGYKKTDKRPLFVYVYGGPLGTGKSVVDGTFQSTGSMFNMYLAQTLGYVTCTIDTRGQSGYSAAFGKANWEQIGKPQSEDLEDLVKYMATNYNIDRTKTGLTGWSFGGFQTQYCMYNTPDVFTLGIAGAGPTQWQNYNTWYSGGVVANAPKGKGEEVDKYSLTHSAKNLKNPLLLLHGMEDTNVLYQDTVFVYRELLKAGKGPLVELSLDPTGGHGLGGDINTRDRHLIYLAFIVKHWGLPDYLGK
ncbi:MAG: S9 family peptidase [Armatimonadetes bacterium]|nr:S9 family peptidase [Armatimonadota bacterium]